MKAHGTYLDGKSEIGAHVRSNLVIFSVSLNFLVKLPEMFFKHKVLIIIALNPQIKSKIKNVEYS